MRLERKMKSGLPRHAVFVLQVLLLMAVTPLASAYIGPGSGISVIGSLLGLLATILLTFGAIVLFPLRKMRKKKLAEALAEGQGREETEENFSAQSSEAPADAAPGEGVSTK